jgi:hypothetical protein
MKDVIVKRYNFNLPSRPSYEYRVFDKLFDKNLNGENTFIMRFYVTSYFIFIVSEKKGSTDERRYYMTPLYFGLDINHRYPDPESMMSKFRISNNNVFITIGNNNVVTDDFVSNINIYSLQYKGGKTNDGEHDTWPWWWRMQYEFASPNPATSEDF